MVHRFHVGLTDKHQDDVDMLDDSHEQGGGHQNLCALIFATRSDSVSDARQQISIGLEAI